ncbi:MAG TPA: class I SAM-dependent methyltransferase [Anaerolineales bacterium]|nr:class I SAM-dependent methyltransferase [Anaerolineales bacterium]
MTNRQSKIVNPQSKDFLFLHLSGLPYFRAFLRAVESAYYQDIDLPSPTLDVGCGDGNFAALTFNRNIDVGLDPWHGPIHEAKAYKKYNVLVEADGGRMPFSEEYFSSAFSNSVLEHIPHVDQVIKETGRVLKPGAPFVFCVPNHNFLSTLSISSALDAIGMRSLGNMYRAFFNKISRHHHCDDPVVWQARLKANDFTLVRWWHYFSPEALRVLEWGHYFGLPSLIAHFLFKRWILSPTRWNLYFIERFLRRFVETPEHPRGSYTFYVARKN